jgi:outer membrane protein
MKSLPEYTVAKQNMATLTSKYEAETKRSEDEFNRKYEEFLEGQHDFAPSILEKRQSELRELLEKNIAFKENSKKLLKQADVEAYAPVKKKVFEAVKTVGQKLNLAFVMNSDEDTLPYVDTNMGIDITDALKIELAH